MLKAFFYTRMYTFWDIVPLAIMLAAFRHNEWVILGFTYVISVAIRVIIDIHYRAKD